MYSDFEIARDDGVLRAFIKDCLKNRSAADAAHWFGVANDMIKRNGDHWSVNRNGLKKLLEDW